MRNKRTHVYKHTLTKSEAGQKYIIIEDAQGVDLKKKKILQTINQNSNKKHQQIDKKFIFFNS